MMPRLGPSSGNVLVIGEAIIDVVQIGTTQQEHPGGSPANVALGLGRRDVPVQLLTQLGRDARGDRLRDHLQHSGVEVLPASFTDAATSTATASLRPDGSVYYSFDLRWSPPRSFIPGRYRLLHIGSAAAFLDPGAAVAAARSPDIAEITFDPNIRPDLLGSQQESVSCFEDLAAASSLVKLSDEDAAWLYPHTTLPDVADRVRRLGADIVVITRGAGGALLQNDAGCTSVPSVRVPVVDTIGAGDTFMVSLIFDLLRPRVVRDLEWLTRVGEAAARAAAITVSRPGADLPWLGELDHIDH